MGKSKQLVLGIGLGALAFAPPILLLMGMMPSQIGPGGVTALAIAGPMILVGFFVVAGVIQCIVSAVLAKKGLGSAAGGVWLVYPLALLLFAIATGYREIRVQLAAHEDYSSREIARPEKKTRTVLLLMEAQRNDGAGFYGIRGQCTDPCIMLLRAGVLDSFAVPSTHAREKQGKRFTVFHFERGEACEEARAIYQELIDLERTFSRLEGERRKAAGSRSSGSLERITQELEEAERRYQYIKGKPQIERGAAATWTLNTRGHIDECVTSSFVDSFEYDIRIDYGLHLRRPYTSSLAVAEIYEGHRAESRLLARWEVRDRKTARVQHFTVSDIIVKLTGKKFDTELAPYPVENVEAELARVASLMRVGAFDVGRHVWIERVLSAKARRLGNERKTWSPEKFALGAESIRNLIDIAPTQPAESRESFFKEISEFLDEETLAGLRKAEAQHHSSSQ